MAKAKPIEIEENEPYVRPEIEIEGNYPEVQRVETGLLTFDMALSNKSNLGMPLRVIIELYGRTGIGKSTLAYYLLGAVAKALEGRIAIADLEMLDREYIVNAVGGSGYKGKIKLEDIVDGDGAPIMHERILMALARDLMKEEFSAALWDSVGATQAMMEVATLTDPDPKGTKQFGEAFMGRKAKLVSQVVQALRTAMMMKASASTVIAINHQHPNLGAPGTNTTGGQRLKYLAGVRMAIWNGLTMKLKDDDPNSLLGFLVYGQTEKMRYGGAGRQFQYYVIPGFGVHPGVTALFDCFELGLAEHTNGRVKLDGRSLGYLKKDFLEPALQGNTRKFYTFQSIIEDYRQKIKSGEIVVDDTKVAGTEVETEVGSE